MDCKPYDLNLIDALENATVGERIEYFEAMFLKNKQFFKIEAEGLYHLLDTNPADEFDINMTESFFDIINAKTKEYLHPKGELNTYAKQLGQWTHGAWVDLTNFKVAISHDKESLHSTVCLGLINDIIEKYPLLARLNAKTTLNLKTCEENNHLRYSPSVAFIGVSHGLHIAEYLNHTLHNHVLLYEPDPSKFVLSCYFLDYEQIKANASKYYLSVGVKSFSLAIKALFQATQLSPYSWIRLLPGYEMPDYNKLVNQIKSKQMSLNDLFFPIDTQLNGFKVAAGYLQSGVPLLSKAPRLSNVSNIAIVASGPSLEHDLAWLKENKEKVIIFCVLSSVRVLKANGIKPDFMFTLDSYLHKNQTAKTFELFDGVPLITIYHTAPEFVADHSPTFLCGSLRQRGLVKFKQPLAFHGGSTTNLAFGMALLCQPNNIYLLGCDCAYESVSKTHIIGTTHDVQADGKEVPNQRVYQEDITQLQVPSNFDKNINVTTNVTFSAGLHSLELMILDYKGKSNVYNLSLTGAHISGATPLRSKSLKLKPLKHKAKDIKQIFEAFSPAKEADNWSYFKGDADEILDRYKKSMISALDCEVKDWAEMIAAFDMLSYNQFEALKTSDEDGRLGCYQQLFSDMFRFILNYLLATDFFHEAEELYRLSVSLFIKHIEKVAWPKELKGF